MHSPCLFVHKVRRKKSRLLTAVEALQLVKLSNFKSIVLLNFHLYKLIRTRASKRVLVKMPLNNNPSVLKEYKGSYGVYCIQFLSK